MPALIPILFFALIFLYFYKRSNGQDWRSSFLSASITWGLFLTVIIELMSIFNLFTFGWTLGLWVLGCLIIFYILTVKRGEFNTRIKTAELVKSRHSRAGGNPSFFNCLKILDSRFHGNDKNTVFQTFYETIKIADMSHFPISLFMSILFIVLTVAFIAFVAPPNNYDSMTYHMSRVVHWIQNHNVNYYPTFIERQLHHPPWAEFAIANFQILSNSDRLANLVQWFSMVGSLIGASLIAKLLGADKGGQILAALVAATIPMGILQASSTQTDYVVSFWLVCFVYYIMLLGENPNRTDLLGVGCSLGLAVFTKATAYIYAFPFLIYFVLSKIAIFRHKLWKPIVVIAISVLSINAGYYIRNIDLYNSPLGPVQTTKRYANETITLPVFVSSVVKNLSLHFSTPFNKVNALIEQGIQRLLTVIGIDVNDPGTNFNSLKYQLVTTPFHEDCSGNPFHLLLIPFVIFLTKNNLRQSRDIMIYFFLVIVAFFLFCLYLKWQPWHSRLHLPLFVLLSPFLGVTLSLIQNKKIVSGISISLIMLSFPVVFNNTSRPILNISRLAFNAGRYLNLTNRVSFPPILQTESILKSGRTDLYFSSRPYMKEPYVETANFIRSQKCSNIGLSLAGGVDYWEYPFWVLLHKYGDPQGTGQNIPHKAIRIEHVDVKNISAKKSELIDNFNPCAIISLKSGKDKEVIINNNIYYLEKSFGHINVLIKQQDNRPMPVTNP